jgi:hypothetical protein
MTTCIFYIKYNILFAPAGLLPKLCVFAVGIAVGFAASSLMVAYQVVERDVFLNLQSVVPSIRANQSQADEAM